MLIKDFAELLLHSFSDKQTSFCIQAIPILHPVQVDLLSPATTQSLGLTTGLVNQVLQQNFLNSLVVAISHYNQYHIDPNPKNTDS